jgi:hypothetical protein
MDVSGAGASVSGASDADGAAEVELVSASEAVLSRSSAGSAAGLEADLAGALAFGLVLAFVGMVMSFWF